MNRSWLSIAILFAIIIVGFLALYLRTTDGVAVEEAQEEPIRIGSVTYEHSFEDGVHSFSGTASVPTRCIAVTATTSVADGTPASIRIELSAPKAEGICLELPAEREFAVEAEAPEDASFEFYGNGEILAATTTP